ncbi:MAG: ATP-dependent DNA ligase [Proteobacteria bacterium]|nr:ATP-dependent DNA ligase [Pseudomonadota bacterium]
MYPIEPPLEPMLAKGVTSIPRDEGWLFEPKWDGFRVLIFRDGDDLYLQSRSLKPMLRYFPELREPCLQMLPERCVVDGELIIQQGDSLSFGTLQMRLHPAKSHIDKLAAETPAQIVLWDLLAEGDELLLEVPFGERRLRLQRVLEGARPPIHLTPITHDPDGALDWFERFEGAGLDGVIAKRADSPYLPKKRAMAKSKHQRTADCVLCGFRWHKKGPGELIGSFILGLWDADGKLHQIGVASSFTAARRKELAQELEPLRAGALEDHPWAAWAASDEQQDRRPGAGSRWNAGKDLSGEPVRLERVVEVTFNQFDGGRLRHPAKFVRWRPDKAVQDCRYDQMRVVPPYELRQILSPGD